MPACWIARSRDCAGSRCATCCLHFRSLRRSDTPKSWTACFAPSRACWWHSPASRGFTRGNLERWIRLEGGEHFDEALRQGRGVLFATAHLGNWELSAFAHALLTGPMNVVVRPLDNPFIDALVERRRAL